jgi:hypothetical protein
LPTVRRFSINLETDASDIGWGGLMVRGTSDSCVLIAHKFFNIWERQQPSTFKELTAPLRFVMSFIALSAGTIVITIQTYSRNLTFIMGRGLDTYML